MKQSSLLIEVIRRRRHTEKKTPTAGRQRARKIAISMIEMGLGDRLLMDAPLRLHRANRPYDYLIAILDARSDVDFPLAVRRHFDELWWIYNYDGKKWLGLRRSAAARRVRDALIAAKVNKLYIPSWQSKQFPRSRFYKLYKYNCFGDLSYLRTKGFYPKLTVPASDHRWAEEFIASHIPNGYDALISMHVRRFFSLPEKNLDPRLIKQVMAYLRAQGRFAFILIGREDDPSGISGPDVFSFVGHKWSFEQTAAVIVQTCLFVGADSGPTHAAAALGVPVIAFGAYGEQLRPFTTPARYVYLDKGESPQLIMAEVKRFVERFKSTFSREKNRWQTNGLNRQAARS